MKVERLYVIGDPLERPLWITNLLENLPGFKIQIGDILEAFEKEDDWTPLYALLERDDTIFVMGNHELSLEDYEILKKLKIKEEFNLEIAGREFKGVIYSPSWELFKWSELRKLLKGKEDVILFTHYPIFGTKYDVPMSVKAPDGRKFGFFWSLGRWLSLKDVDPGYTLSEALDEYKSNPEFRKFANAIYLHLLLSKTYFRSPVGKNVVKTLDLIDLTENDVIRIPIKNEDVIRVAYTMWRDWEIVYDVAPKSIKEIREKLVKKFKKRKLWIFCGHLHEMGGRVFRVENATEVNVAKTYALFDGISVYFPR